MVTKYLNAGLLKNGFLIWEAETFINPVISCALSSINASSPAWIFFGRFRRVSQGRMNSKRMLERQCKVRIGILIHVS